MLLFSSRGATSGRRGVAVECRPVISAILSRHALFTPAPFLSHLPPPLCSRKRELRRSSECKDQACAKSLIKDQVFLPKTHPLSCVHASPQPPSPFSNFRGATFCHPRTHLAYRPQACPRNHRFLAPRSRTYRPATLHNFPRSCPPFARVKRGSGTVWVALGKQFPSWQAILTPLCPRG